MQESGIARAIVVASAAQVVLATVAGFYFGEKLNVFHVAAVVLSCCAFALSFAGSQTASAPSQSHSTIQIEENSE